MLHLRRKHVPTRDLNLEEPPNRQWRSLVNWLFDNLTPGVPVVSTTGAGSLKSPASIWRSVVLITFIVGMMAMGRVAWADLNDGLVAYYPFNGNANDESGNGNDGTVNGATLTEDRFGNTESAYDFDGRNNRILVNSSDSLNIDHRLTVAAWFKRDTAKSYTGLVGNDWSGYTFINDGNKLILELAHDMPSQAWVSFHNSYTIENNTWYHVVVTLDSLNENTNKVTFYVNGQKGNEFPTSYSDLRDMSNLYIGYQGCCGRYFDGTIDDVRIYNRALSEDEVKELLHGHGGPTASFTASPILGEPPLEVSLDANASNDPNGTIESYAWAVSNGDTANGVTTTMTFTECGLYTIVLTVTDNDSNTATAERTISVVGESCAGVDGTQSAAKFKVTLTKNVAWALKQMGKKMWINGSLALPCSTATNPTDCQVAERSFISPTLYEPVTKVGRSSPHQNVGNPYDPIQGSGIDTRNGALICEKGPLNANTCGTNDYFPDRVTDYWFNWLEPTSLNNPYQADGNAFDEGPTTAQINNGVVEPEEVHTRIVSMNLTSLPVRKPVSADVLRAGNKAPCQPPSVGEVESLDDDGIGFPAESFFHMYVEVDVDLDRDKEIDITVANASGPGTGIDRLKGGEPLVIENGQLDDFPPTVVYTHTGSNDANDGDLAPMLYQIDKDSCAIGEHIGWIRIAAHGMNFGQPVSQRKRTLRDGNQPPRSIEEFEEIFDSLSEMPIEPETDCPCLPIASFTAEPSSGNAPLEVTLDASASYDPDGTIVSYSWAASNGDTANGVTTTMTFTEKGSYLIVLTVTDNDGNTATAERTISVGSPNLVGLANFTATTKDDGIHLDWETVSEIDNAGFYIVRARDENGKYTEVIRITEQLIQSVDGSINGASYSYVDSNVISGNTYYYALEDIEFSGKRTIHLEFIDSATAK